jgi:hypothetical protein
MWSPVGIGCGCHVALRTLSAKAAGFPPDCAIKEIIRPGTRGFVRAVQPRPASRPGAGHDHTRPGPVLDKKRARRENPPRF